MINKIKLIADDYPHKIAYVINNEKITYRQLWNLAEEKSILLKKQGTEAVLIYGHKEINMIVSILACIIARRAYIPIEYNLPRNRIRQIIMQSHASLLLKNKEISFDEIPCHTLDQLTQYENYPILESNNSIAYIMFTSGTTGKPKGVPITRDNLANFIYWISSLSPLSNFKNIKVLNQANFSFDLSIADMFYALCNGHTLVAIDDSTKNDYPKLFNVIKENEINLFVSTPSFIKLCLLNEEFNYENYPFIQCYYLCGEQLEPKTVKKIWKHFPKIDIINAYGPTEATSAVSGVLITEDMLNDTILPVGAVNNFATIIEIDEEEIVLKGKSVFPGYLNNGKEKSNLKDYYHTGDIGVIKEGLLYCIGRKDNQIKFKGYRIELNEIEYHLNNVKGVIDAKVVAIYDDEIVKMIKAYVILKWDISEMDLKLALSEQLPKYMIPSMIKKVEQFPITANDKIDWMELRKL